MATNTASSPPISSLGPPPESPAGRLVDRRLDKTRFRIKLVDLAIALMALSAGVLAFLLVVATIDHWVVGLSVGFRLLALTVLIGGVLFCCAARALPLVFRRINPVYAARAIEQSQPSLKNSLINFLMVRTSRSSVGEGVYEALEERAAADLSRVEVEAGVDRSRLIVVGYVLAGVMAACAAYKILSPKDPFQTAARILSPWSEIPRPSVVRIEEVDPGNAEVYQGERVTVTAKVLGADDCDPVTLFYTTKDGQIVDRRVAMVLSDSGLRRRCELPAEGSGVQQDLIYHIEAGDAATSAYRLTARPAPAIFVERVRYDYPAYTGRPPLVVERQGDLRALEGSRMTISARANQPIRSAQIELDPEIRSSAQRDHEVPARRPQAVPMQAKGAEASGGFVLELMADRKTPKHAAYQLRFVTPSGRQNDQPVLHQIEVVRDLPPEVEILLPQQQRVTVPVSGRQTIQIRAVDPDFALSKVVLRAVCAGADLIDARLLDQPAGHPGQAVTSFEFEPRKLGLAAGDQVVYWAVAEDNRTSVLSALPEPNSARTRNYHIEVVTGQGRQASEANSQSGDRGQSEENQKAAPKEGPDSPEPGSRGDQRSDAAQQQKPPDPGQKSGQQKQKENPPDAAASGGQQSKQEQPRGGDQQQEQSPDQPESPDQPAAGAAGQQSPAAPQQRAEPGNQAGQGAGNSKEPAADKSGGPQGAGDQKGSSAAQGAGDQKGSGSPQQLGKQPGADDLRQEPLHDGEVIEKINEYRQRQGAAAGTGKSPQRAEGVPKPDRSDQKTEQPPSADDTAGAGKPADSQQSPGAQPRDGARPAAEGMTAAERNKPASGEGGSPQKGGGPEDPDKAQGKPKPSSERKGPGLGDEGKSGAGRDSQDRTGAPASQGDNRDRGKTTPPEAAPPKQAEQAQSPSTSKRQSDSSGAASGDRSGGGGKGGGQGANRQGNDSGGANSPADKGAGASNESGQGQTANSAGDKQQSRGPTGSSGADPGAGKTTRPAGGDRQGAQPSKDASQSQDPGKTAPQPGQGAGQLLGGGRPGNQLAQKPPEASGDAPPGDEPNLQYARKAADLALEYLKDHQRNPDPQLLKELSWTPEDWKQFLARWERLKRLAGEQGGAGKRELDESLRSLGLQPAGDKFRRGGGRADQLRGLRDSGGRSAPPPAYQELFDAYRKGAARSSDE